jgi:hypothetical protein
MKLQMCVILVLVIGCDPSNPFVSFPSPDSVPAVESDATVFDGGAAADSGVIVDTDSGQDAGRADSGAMPETGSGGAGGSGSTAAGGSAPVSTGGSPPAAGGAPVDACVLTTHTNGLGGTWRNCVPLGTYDKSQATHACEASGAKECRPTNCGTGTLLVCGYDDARNYVYGCWGYEGDLAGYAKERSDSCSAFNASWG